MHATSRSHVAALSGRWCAIHERDWHFARCTTLSRPGARCSAVCGCDSARCPNAIQGHHVLTSARVPVAGVRINSPPSAISAAGTLDGMTPIAHGCSIFKKMKKFSPTVFREPYRRPARPRLAQPRCARWSWQSKSRRRNNGPRNAGHTAGPMKTTAFVDAQKAPFSDIDFVTFSRNYFSSFPSCEFSSVLQSAKHTISRRHK